MGWSTIVKFVSIPQFIMGNGSQFIFKTIEEQIQFFNSHVVTSLTYENQSYMRLTGGTARFKVNADTLTSLAPNWIMFQNKDFGEKWFFANITDFYYISPKVTEVTYSVDSFQSFMFDIVWDLKSYIARRSWCSYDSTTRLANLPMEDIDIGSEYVIADCVFDFNDSTGDQNDDQWYYLLLTKKLTKTGSTHHTVTPTKNLSYYTGNTEVTKEYHNGQVNVLYGYVMNYRCLYACVTNGLFQSDCDLVNALQMCVQLPFGDSMFESGLDNIAGDITTKSSPKFGSNLPEGSKCYDQAHFGNMTKQTNVNHWSESLCDYIKKIMHDDDSTWSYNSDLPDSAIGKYLLRYPYSLLEIYDFYNQPLSVGINQINPISPFSNVGTNKSLETYKYAAIGQNPMLVYGLKNYMNTGYSNNFNSKNTIGNIYGYSSSALNTIQASIQLPIISDYLASFLQSNMNQINAQRANLRDTLQTQLNNAGASLQASATSIAVSQRNALINARTTAQNSYLQTQSSLNAQVASLTTQRNSDISVNHINASALETKQSLTNQANIFSTVSGAASSGFFGLMTGMPWFGVLGAATGFAAGMTNRRLQAADINSQISLNNQQGKNIQAQYNTSVTNAVNLAAASNKANANTLRAAMQITANTAEASNAQAQAAFGNATRTATTAYQNEIRSLNARIQDAKNVPPSVQNMGNNYSNYNVMYNRDCIKYTTKAIPPEQMRRVIDYFTRYGFLTNRSENLKTIKDRFLNNNLPGFFIQTVNANVAGQIPMEHLTAIRDMLDAGVHFWTKDHYLDYDAMKGV